MKRIANILILSILVIGCNESHPIIPPSSSIVDWEGHGGLTNDRYADSIIFLSTRHVTNLGMAQMHIMNRNGLGLRSLAADSFVVYYAATWSPHKWKIIFLADTYNTRAIYSMDCDGTNRRRIPVPSQLMMPTIDWSPDGQKIAYVEIDPVLGCRVGVMNPDGTSAVGISPWYPAVYRVSWSPSSSAIAFSPFDSTGGSIMTIKPDGSDLRSLITGVNASNPSWSPDGRYIAYTANFSRIIVHDLQTHQNTQLTSGPGDDWPTWSTDSRTIVFSSINRSDPNRSALYSVQIDGTNRIALTDDLAGDYSPVWQK